MKEADLRRAVTATREIVSACGLPVDDAVVLSSSNKLSLQLRPCDVMARVAPGEEHVFPLEIQLAQQLAAGDCPAAALDPRIEPRIYERDGFAVTLWTYYEPETSQEIAPAEYADVLGRLHTGLRMGGTVAPHFTNRIENAQELLADTHRTPALLLADRHLLEGAIRRLRQMVEGRGPEQLLHGEPHPGNLLATRKGPIFIDFETACYGPVEFDVAHAPEEVSEHYPLLDRDLLSSCRLLVLALVTTWRWDRDDQFPNGRQLGNEWLNQLRSKLRAD